jgi:hypothetical protein
VEFNAVKLTIQDEVMTGKETGTCPAVKERPAESVEPLDNTGSTDGSQKKKIKGKTKGQTG